MKNFHSSCDSCENLNNFSIIRTAASQNESKRTSEKERKKKLKKKIFR